MSQVHTQFPAFEPHLLAIDPDANARESHRSPNGVRRLAALEQLDPGGGAVVEHDVHLFALVYIHHAEERRLGRLGGQRQSDERQQKS